MAIAIDGEIFQDAYGAELGPTARSADPEDRRRISRLAGISPDCADALPIKRDNRGIAFARD